ncbi:MAG: hypothetical protein SVR94_06985 [Pseudomonadota bacterium]|nr:hypothetical protein [Pseudomonadota bacterium]
MRNEIWESHAKLVFGQLNEKHCRGLAGLLSEVIGWGGTKQIAEATGIDPKTIRQERLGRSIVKKRMKSIRMTFRAMRYVRPRPMGFMITKLTMLW